MALQLYSLAGPGQWDSADKRISLVIRDDKTPLPARFGDTSDCNSAITNDKVRDPNSGDGRNSHDNAHHQTLVNGANTEACVLIRLRVCGG